LIGLMRVHNLGRPAAPQGRTAAVARRTQCRGSGEEHFRQALDWARRQGALSWELRAATSHAQLLRDQGQSADVLALLQSVYDRFTEGFDTADLQHAESLLGNLRQSSWLKHSRASGAIWYIRENPFSSVRTL
jgi:predicted ATPase